MKIINYSFLNKKEQSKEKGIILKDNDIIHILIDKKIDTEIIVICKDNKLEILPRNELFANKKKDNLD